MATRGRTDLVWTPMPLLLTTGTSPSSQRTIGLRNWTVVHGWRSGRDGITWSSKLDLKIKSTNDLIAFKD